MFVVERHVLGSFLSIQKLFFDVIKIHFPHIFGANLSREKIEINFPSISRIAVNCCTKLLYTFFFLCFFFFLRFRDRWRISVDTWPIKPRVIWGPSWSLVTSRLQRSAAYSTRCSKLCDSMLNRRKAHLPITHGQIMFKNGYLLIFTVRGVPGAKSPCQEA